MGRIKGQSSPRILTTHSVKQRAHRKKHVYVTNIAPRTSGIPKDSWWATSPQVGFTASAEKETQRMKFSVSGRIGGSPAFEI